MKFLKPFLFFLLAVVAATLILSFFLPTSQKVERSVTIKASAAAIYAQLVKLDNFNKISIWSQQDSSAKYTFAGTDGTVGASTSWTGDQNVSGEGKIEISALEENKKITHKISFSKPRSGTAVSSFTLTEKNGLTTVTWDFIMATPRPWNIYNLFYSMDKEVGKDFGYSLTTLKTLMEKMAGTATVEKKYEVEQMNFPATTFATVRQLVQWSDLPAFFEQHFPIIFAEAAKEDASPGTNSALIYIWDEKTQQADIAAALPVTAGTKIENNIVQVVTIPASKAVYVNYYGSYDNETGAYNSIKKYLTDNKLTQKVPVIEQYMTDPMNEPDTAKWLTKIVFLVE